MVDSSTQSIVIDAPSARIAEVIAEFGAYPEWISGMQSTEVLEEFEDGYGHLVKFRIDAGIFKDTYELRYDYSEDLNRISWTLDKPSSVQKAQTGSYDLDDQGDGTTRVTYTLAVDLSIPMLGMFKRKAEKIIMDSALKELKKRVEGTR
ncbi:MAG TPA: SRPBCC family protein [Stackebrandtia sp.]|jgi:carbon monoxide dehydrogenase subunit G|uniref:SRPBCC family protein n=1 Tax=Stackebrandtia sp. TaxID=2023065 RepID=UPI002D26DBA6|nr:SRPBCC family protein [Stackebrandtia sp.]HZE37600.1 SRPBCC family protein [Stackebrandtia sp.]